MANNFYTTKILPKLLNRAMSDATFDDTRQKVAGEAHGTVLEIGGGSGLNLPFYKNISKLYLLEPSKELLDMTKRRATSVSYPIEYIPASAEHIPLPDTSIDTVISTWTLCSIPNVSQALTEIRRVLKPGGTFAFVEHGVAPNRFIRFFQHILTPVSRRLFGNCHLDRDIQKLLTDAGFDVHVSKQSYESGRPLMYGTRGVGRA